MDRPEADPQKGTRTAPSEDASVLAEAPAGLAPHLDEPAGRTERQWDSDPPRGRNREKGEPAQEDERTKKGENPR